VLLAAHVAVTRAAPAREPCALGRLRCAAERVPPATGSGAWTGAAQGLPAVEPVNRSSSAVRLFRNRTHGEQLLAAAFEHCVVGG
jgi:hypothetical protein